MTPDDDEDDRLGPLMDEFLKRKRLGEFPSLTEFVERHPELETEIRDLFPAVAMMEQAEVTGVIPNSAAAVTIDGHELKQLGDYRIIREIGRGGMGVVFEAVQESLGRHVAIKILPWQSVVDNRQIRRFQREARVAASLHHTGIVPVFGVGERDGIHYFAMQFIRGQGVDSILAELRRMRQESQLTEGNSVAKPNGQSAGLGSDPSTADQDLRIITAGIRLEAFESPEYSEIKGCASDSGAGETESRDSAPETESIDLSAPSTDEQFHRNVASLGMQAADALGYAHGRGVVHRDIKPSNLLIDLNGNLWITDFGLAKSLAHTFDECGDSDVDDDLTATGELIGTLRYMPPERMTGDNDGRSDIYSLGLTLYELLTLRPAFDETDRGRLLQKIAKHEVVAPRRIDSRIPRDLETIVLKATDPNPVQRYQTATELAEDLRRFLSNRPIVARRPSLTEVLLLWARRKPAVAALSMIVISLVVTLSIGSFVAAYRLADEQRRTLGHLQDSRTATVKAQRKTFQSLIDRAQAIRRGNAADRRDAALNTIRQAAELLSETSVSKADRFTLRNEAIAALCLYSLSFGPDWTPDHFVSRSAMPSWNSDQHCTVFAHDDSLDSVIIRRLSDFCEIGRLKSSRKFRQTYFRPEFQFSPNGRFLACRALLQGNVDEYFLQVWDCEKGERVFEQQLARAEIAGNSRYCFEPLSGRLVFMPQGSTEIRVMDLDSKSTTVLFDPGYVPLTMEISAAEDRIALSRTEGSWITAAPGTERGVEIRDFPGGQLQHHMPHPFSVVQLEWCGDDVLATATHGGTVYLWSLSRPHLPWRVHHAHTRSTVSLNFSQQLGLIASSGLEGQTCFLNMQAEEVLRVDQICRKISGDGTRAIFVQPYGTLNRAEIHLPHCCRLFQDTQPNLVLDEVHDVTYSPDGRLQVLLLSRGFTIRNVTSGEVLVRERESRFTRAAFSSDGRSLVVAGSDGLRVLAVQALWNGRLQSVKNYFPVADGFPELQSDRFVTSDISQSDDGSVVAVTQRQKKTIVIRQRPDSKGQDVTSLDTQYLPHFGTVSPDGRFVSTSVPWTIRRERQTAGVIVWETSSYDEVVRLPYPEGTVGNMVFSHDSRLLAVVVEDCCALWDTTDWTLRKTIPIPPNVVTNAAFSSDGRYLAVVDAGVVRLFDATSLTELAHLRGPTRKISFGGTMTSPPGLAFTPDSQRLAVGTEGGMTFEWDLVRIRQELKTLRLNWPSVSPTPVHAER